MQTSKRKCTRDGQYHLSLAGNSWDHCVYVRDPIFQHVCACLTSFTDLAWRACTNSCSRTQIVKFRWLHRRARLSSAPKKDMSSVAGGSNPSTNQTPEMLVVFLNIFLIQFESDNSKIRAVAHGDVGKHSSLFAERLTVQIHIVVLELLIDDILVWELCSFSWPITSRLMCTSAWNHFALKRKDEPWPRCWKITSPNLIQYSYSEKLFLTRYIGSCETINNSYPLRPCCIPWMIKRQTCIHSVPGGV